MSGSRRSIWALSRARRFNVSYEILKKPKQGATTTTVSSDSVAPRYKRSTGVDCSFEIRRKESAMYTAAISAAGCRPLTTRIAASTGAVYSMAALPTAHFGFGQVKTTAAAAIANTATRAWFIVMEGSRMKKAAAMHTLATMTSTYL